jgi:hypothetical protein
MVDVKDTPARLSAWTFLNSSFGLWLFSAIFITGAGSTFTYLQAQNSEAIKNKEYIEKLDLEISFRFSQFLNLVYELSTMDSKVELRGGKKPDDVLRLYNGLREPSSVTLGFLYPEFRQLGVTALEAELRRVLKGKERDEVDQALSYLTNGTLLGPADFSNLNRVGATALKSMAKRWKDMRFAFVDCPEAKPFC